MKKLFILLVLLSLTVLTHPGFGADKNPLRKKLKSIMIKHIQYEDVAIDVVVVDLKKRVLKLNSAAKGINIIVALIKGEKPELFKVNLNMDNIPLEAAIDYISRSAGLQYFIKDNTVIIASRKIAKEGMEIRTFRAKPHAVSTLKRIYKDAKIEEKGGGSTKKDDKLTKIDEEIFE